MPLQPINFAGIKPITPYTGQPTPDFIQEFMQAMRRPQAMQEERQMNQATIEKQKLANALDQQFGAREREGKIALNDAYKKYYEMGGGLGGGPGRGTMTPLEKARDYEQRVLSEYGPDSDEARIARQAVQKTAGTALPATTTNRMIRARVANNEKNYLLDNVQMPYIGRNSNRELVSDRSKYIRGNLGPQEKAKLKEKLVQASLATRMLPDLTFTQLQSITGEKGTDHEIKAQKKSNRQGWPELTTLATENFPKDIQEESDRRYKELLHGVSGVRQDTTQNIMQRGPNYTEQDPMNNTASTVDLVRENFPEFQNYSDEDIMHWLGNSEVGKRILKGL